jgi:hypothetical protein
MTIKAKAKLGKTRHIKERKQNARHGRERQGIPKQLKGRQGTAKQAGMEIQGKAGQEQFEERKGKERKGQGNAEQDQKV